MTPFAVSFSMAKTWRECRQRWHYKYKRKLRRKRPSAPALWRGTIVHELLELHLQGKSWRDKLDEHQAKFDQLMVEEQEHYGMDFVQQCGRIVEGYERHWAVRHPKMETVAVEVEFGEHEPCEVIPGLFVRGRIDWLCKDARGLWVGEHKTVRRYIPSEGFRLLDLQTAVYAKVCEVLGYGTPVGVMFDYLRTKPPATPKVLKDGSLSRAKKVDTDYHTLKAAIEKHGLKAEDYEEELERARANKFYDRRYLPKPRGMVDELLREMRVQSVEMQRLGNHPYRNPRRECDKCEYHALCQAELMGLDTHYLLEAEYAVKDDEPVTGPATLEELAEEEDGGEEAAE